jgi:formylglycine-generating enzyme required for sulfatase activity
MSALPRSFGHTILAVLAAVVALLLLPTMTHGETVRPTARGRAVPANMVTVPAGSYVPLYGAAGPAGSMRVATFRLDRDLVTMGDYLAFVRANPSWRRSAVRPVFAERGYLAEWTGDLEPATPLDQPVTGVSWFAAKAYCAAQGKRLPTTDEWEYAAAASETKRDAARDPGFVRRLVTLYANRAGHAPVAGAGFRNRYGVDDLHGVVWEWTLDFNGVLVSDDSRELGSGVRASDHHLFCASAAIGATDPSNYPAFLRYAFRAGLTGRSTVGTLGFRCAAGNAAA